MTNANKLAPWEYRELMLVSYDPHNTIMERVRKTSRIAAMMRNDGYTEEEVLATADEAREILGLETIPR